MKKKLYILQIFSNFVIEIKKQLHQSDMDNFFAKFGKILDVCKHFSKDLVNEHGNMPRRGVVPKFSDLEVIALAAAVMEPLARQASERIRGTWAPIVTIVMCLAALALNLLHWQKPGRDQAMLNDIDLMATQVERGETVAITPPLAHNYSLHGYWYFYHRVSLDVNPVHPHLIATTDAVDSSYHEVPLPTEQYRLYAHSAK